METSKSILIAAVVLGSVLLTPDISSAQILPWRGNAGQSFQGPYVECQTYGSAPYTVTSQPHRGYHSATTYPPVRQDPFSVCKCGPNGGDDCGCKNLNCRITMPPCSFGPKTNKTPIPVNVIGKIPKKKIPSNCLELLCRFTGPTEVPEIHCITEECVEIGKTTLECLPGCCFSVCVPINDCTTEKVECKLVMQDMRLELWRRIDKGRIVYDIYVINDPNASSPFHAGGMPEKWLVLHCGSAGDVRTLFPNAVQENGQPLISSSANEDEGTSSRSDVRISLEVDEKKVNQYLKEVAEEVSGKSDETAKASS